ncbi:MAG: hypothetical protein DI586_10895 [Micavibrio aeruginosavorus]|uniref:Uncharacterized protein n=1 Tax=Micavibrio aeruginosavorus TaxID=349221 RepID=A0A2W5FGX2_9BACT|nr:MAG: hypothetical protein DI586_10895 [Micavibrio aeruginosavorus]
MKKDLLVVFHSSADADPGQQSALERATFKYHPSAAHCCKPGERVSGSKGNYHYINGTKVDEAIDTIANLASKKDVVIVSLSADMKHAALAHRIPVVTDIPRIVQLAMQPR